MGAWGLGPFDSDGALDYLGDLADRHAQVIDSDIVAGSVDRPAVHDALLEALVAVTRPESADEYRPQTVEDAYAAAGLVAAALTDDLEVTGTRLFAPPAEGSFASLGLGANCGFVGLLDRATAASLVPSAIAAAAAIPAERDWVSTWGDSEGILRQVSILQGVLETHVQPAPTS